MDGNKIIKQEIVFTQEIMSFAHRADTSPPLTQKSSLPYKAKKQKRQTLNINRHFH